MIIVQIYFVLLYNFSWNRERADGTDGDPDESEDQERKDHLSQSQYHFFSIRGITY